MKLTKLIDNCLKFSISKDETRYYLQGVYFDPKLKNAVSTDGYIMTYSQEKYDEELSDKIIDFNNMQVIKKEYLKYSSVIPKKFDNSEYVKIDKNEAIKNQRHVKIKAFYVKNKGFIFAESINEEYEFAINPYFLKPLIGYTLTMEYSGKYNPIRFTLKDGDSYYIIMPIRV